MKWTTKAMTRNQAVLSYTYNNTSWKLVVEESMYADHSGRAVFYNLYENDQCVTLSGPANLRNLGEAPLSAGHIGQALERVRGYISHIAKNHTPLTHATSGTSRLIPIKTEMRW